MYVPVDRPFGARRFTTTRGNARKRYQVNIQRYHTFVGKDYLLLILRNFHAYGEGFLG